MNFKEWMDSKGDESDDLGLIDAWKAGALAMFDRLLDLSDVDEGLKKLIRAEIDALMEDNE